MEPPLGMMTMKMHLLAGSRDSGVLAWVEGFPRFYPFIAMLGRPMKQTGFQLINKIP